MATKTTASRKTLASAASESKPTAKKTVKTAAASVTKPAPTKTAAAKPAATKSVAAKPAAKPAATKTAAAKAAAAKTVAAAKPVAGGANAWDQMMANAAEVASTFRKRPQVKVSSPWREGFGRPLSQRSREIYEHITANKTRLKQKD